MRRMLDEASAAPPKASASLPKLTVCILHRAEISSAMKRIRAKLIVLPK
ncbi:MAG: hypothetical protein MJZ25_16710 [Fibrobacter sp.]|nr:hypothetical protein [Fibrobacter sp.]